MAAETTLMLSFVKAADHVLVSRNTYGGTYRFFSKVLANFGVTFAYVDTTDVEAVRKAVTPATRMLFVETPTNPTMEISDLKALADLARAEGSRIGSKIRVVVDNTFATPFFQRPLALGCDAVVHSTTKYLNGHSDSVGGAVICADVLDGAKIGFTQNAAGGILSPFDSFLVSRGIKTLPVRMKAHDANGRVVAAWLARHPKVLRVFYPGLPAHPGHAVASKQMSGFGGMIAFDLRLRGRREAPPRPRRRLRARRVARRRREPHLAPGDDDARERRARGAAPARHHAGPRARLGRHRGRRGHPRGPRTRARGSLTPTGKPVRAAACD